MENETVMVKGKRNGDKILTPLPRKKTKSKYPCVDWKETIGMSVDVLYCGKTYEGINIIGYGNNIKGYIDVEYNGKEMSFCPGNFKTCQLGELLGEITKEYRYEVGDILELNNSKIRILKQTRIISNRKDRGNCLEKGYLVECLKCKYPDGSPYKYEILESNISSNKGCAICNNNITITGINDFATLKPELIKWFKDPLDATSVSLQCNERRIFKCIHCGFERSIIVGNFHNKGFRCKKCGDNTSYPEKLMTNILVQLDEDFTCQYSPKYLHVYTNGKIGRKQSDFYLNRYKIVIETDGILGHEGGVVHGYSKRTLEEHIADDKWKDEQHLLHGVKTIRINCFESNMEYIRENILKSELVNYFDFSKVDWVKADRETATNLKIEACRLKRENPNITLVEISKIINRKVCTVRKYLKFGNEHGWCNYEPKKFKNKEIE